MVVLGDDTHLVTDQAIQLRAELSQELLSEVGLEEFRRSRDLDAIAQSVETPPFLAVRRVVLIWDPPQLESGRRSDSESERLAEILGRRPDSTAVVVVCRRPGAAASNLVLRLKKAGAELRRLQRPRGAELRGYVRRRLQLRGLRLGRAVEDRLLEVAQRDLGQLEQELEKLSVLAAGAAAVGDAEALRLVTPAPPTEAYRLTDALFESPARAGARLRDLRQSPDYAPQMLVGALARVLRDLIAYSDPGAPPSSDLPSWREDKLRAHLRRSRPERLQTWLVELADLDWRSRTGELDLDEGLEFLLGLIAAELSPRVA